MVAGEVSNYLSPATTSALVSSTVLSLGSFSTIALLGIPSPSSPSSSSSSSSSSSPEVTLLSSCSYLFTNFELIKPIDAALGFTCLGILIAVKVIF
jgi:hypothetical protein